MNKDSIKKMALFSLNTFVALGVLSTTIIPFSKPSQAQISRCKTTFLRNTLGTQTNFTNGKHIITLVRAKRVRGNPSFKIYVNRRFAGNFIIPNTLISGQLTLGYRLGPNFSGKVVQKPVAISCSPWRRI